MTHRRTIGAMRKPAIDLSRLTADEKFNLIDDLWGTLTPDDETPSPELRAELGCRLDRLERAGLVGVAWDDVRAEMFAAKP